LGDRAKDGKTSFCDGHHIFCVTRFIECRPLRLGYTENGYDDVLFPLQEAPAVKPRSQSVWRQFLSNITDGPTPRAEDAIAAYLHRHQHDLPAALWIELERRRLIS
jgi:hypothetical protein